MLIYFIKQNLDLQYKEIILEKAVFRWPVRVYHEDVDTMAIVYYANYLKYLERARTEWLRSLNIDQKQLHHDYGIWFVVKNISADYKASAKLDDPLEITVTIARQSKTSVVIHQQICRDGQVLLSADIVLVCATDMNQHRQPVPLRPAQIPNELIELWKAYL